MANVGARITLLSAHYPPEVTGSAPYAGGLASGLARRGFAASVVAAHPHYPQWEIYPGYGDWSRRELIGGVSVRRLRHFVPRQPTGWGRLLAEISFGLRVLGVSWAQPDVVVLASPALVSSIIAGLRARVFHRSTPVVVWVQDLYSVGLAETGLGGGLVLALMRRIEGWLLRTADHVVVIHDRFKRRVSDDFKVPESRITVIPNWSHVMTADGADRAQVRSDRGWPSSQVVVVHAGNMGLKQGLENVVEAARLAALREESIRFVLLGDGSERVRLAELGRGVTTLEFAAPLDQEAFAATLSAADILLVNEKAGVSEMSVPSKLTSYFAAGRPVVAATDAGGITADVIRAAGAGVVIPAGDPRALLDAALRLAADPERGDELGRNGLLYRRSELSESDAVDRFSNLLSGLATHGRAP